MIQSSSAYRSAVYGVFSELRHAEGQLRRKLRDIAYYIRFPDADVIILANVVVIPLEILDVGNSGNKAIHMIFHSAILPFWA